MALYTYDAEVDVLYALLVEEPQAVVHRTIELTDCLHVDLDDQDGVVGVEVMYPRVNGVDLTPLRERFGIDLDIPFSFAA